MERFKSTERNIAVFSRDVTYHKRFTSLHLLVISLFSHVDFRLLDGLLVCIELRREHRVIVIQRYFKYECFRRFQCPMAERERSATREIVPVFLEALSQTDSESTFKEPEPPCTRSQEIPA